MSSTVLTVIIVSAVVLVLGIVTVALVVYSTSHAQKRHELSCTMVALVHTLNTYPDFDDVMTWALDNNSTFSMKGLL